MRRTLALLLVALVSLLSGPHRAQAAGSQRPTALSLEVPAAVPVGERFDVTARLSGPSGELYGAVENEVLQLLIDGVHYRRERTNFAGAARFVITQPLPVGQHTVTAVYEGSASLAPAAATTILTVAPAVLEIETVPALAGLAVRSLDREFRTGPDGRVQIPFQESGPHPIEIEREFTTPTFRARFARWNDDVFAVARSVTVPKHQRLQAGYDLETVVSYRFVDLEGQPVDPGRVERMILKSSMGEVRELRVADADATAPILKASRAIPTHAGLVSSPVQWSVEAIIVRGTNVVNRKQQRFYPAEQTDWTITLLLYTATFSVRDTFFGLPSGRSVLLTYPDGSSERLVLEGGTGSARSLPRGDYRVQAADFVGWSPVAPLALSRDQSVDLTVMSWRDLGLVLTLVLASATALLIAGRPQLRHLRRNRNGSEPRRVPTRADGRARRLALVILLTLVLSGTFFLTQGLARNQRPRAAAPPAEAARPTATVPPPRVATVPTPQPTTIPQSSTTEPAPQFRDFWERNGGLASFGPATTEPYWSTAEDGAGVLVQDFALARLEYRPERTGSPYAIELARLGAREAMALGLAASEPFRRRSPDAPPGSDCTYFTQTGHWVCGSLRAYWRRNGLDLGDPGISPRESLALFGYPLSEAFLDEHGRTVQYFERAKLVTYPEFRGTANEVVRDPIVRRDP